MDSFVAIVVKFLCKTDEIIYSIRIYIIMFFFLIIYLFLDIILFSKAIHKIDSFIINKMNKDETTNTGDSKFRDN